LTGLLTLDSLLKQIDELQLEKKEFGLQRAKMKGFILQKEGDQFMLCWLLFVLIFNCITNIFMHLMYVCIYIYSTYNFFLPKCLMDFKY